MPHFTIRKMLLGDIDQLAVLYRDYWNEDSDTQKMKQKYAELEADSRYIFLSAVRDDRLVGSIMGIVCDELYGRCESFLVMEDLIVEKNHRNNGIGRSLLDALETIAKERGCCQIQFITETAREDTISFYKSLGYDPSSHVGFKRKL